MSDNTSSVVLANPATPDAPPQAMALVLVAARVVSKGADTFVVPAGQVIRIITLPAITSFVPPKDCKLISAGILKVGNMVSV
jgi:hypothetical protein